MSLAMLAITPPTAIAKTQFAKFKLTLHGTQSTPWSDDRVNEGTGTPCHGEGNEQVSFATPHPLTVKVRTGKPDGPKYLWFGFRKGGPNGWGDPSLKVKADVQRTVTWAGDCLIGSAIPQSCARSANGLDWSLLLEGDPFEKSSVELSEDFTLNQADPFPDCTSSGLGFVEFPTMVFNGGGPIDPGDVGGLVLGHVNRQKLFNPHVKHLTITANDKFVDVSAPGDPSTHRATANISYAISLKRKG
jgi:hypothetical protein